MSKNTWTETHLYKALKARTGDYADSIKNLLDRPEVMPAIEYILDKGGTTPKDFTLHDADHSFRVAERMWDIIPETTRNNLSDYEIGFLILSAYLHDIGMSPEFDKVESHRLYLVSDVKNQLSEEEINSFQKWIDDDTKTASLDIRSQKVEDETLLTHILTYYVRFKHNDWSGNWIEKHLSGFTLKDYNGWTTDLIKVCKSHHYGLNELIKDAFNPKPIGSVNLHLRYLAMCLRVSDVMENDPERTPTVILMHRHINSSSLTYWLKDKQFTLTRKDNNFNIYARPNRAYIHKAIEDTALWIEDELRLCDELTKLKPLNHSPFANIDYYKWELGTFLYKDISPEEDTYVYIQGAFRPNTAKILELLGGNQLYGDHIWAYRELLQNSFDAVKERIAYTIINENRNPKEYQKKLGEIYSINVELENRQDGIWLVCKDQGVGMTKTILEKFFLESGSSKRHEIVELERKAKLHGFTFSRIGQFGIGVLSYFMIAEKVVVRTKRELNTGYPDADSKAWYFEINGSHDFGELRKANTSVIGTHIEFKLRSEIANDIENWNTKFRQFMNESIAFAPCQINYSSYLEEQSKVINVGWTNGIQDIKAKIVHQFMQGFKERVRRTTSGILARDQERRLQTNETLSTEVLRQIPSMIDFLYDEGELAEVGKYRILIPYFKLMEGNSLFYMKEHVTSKKHEILQVFEGFFLLPKFRESYFSLKGINVNVVGSEYNNYQLNTRRHINVHIEIDIENSEEKNLSVSRHTLIYEEKFAKIKADINEKINSLFNANATLFKNKYYTLNRECFDLTNGEEYWFFWDSDETKIVWKKAMTPIIESSYSYWSKSKYKNKNVLACVHATDYFGDRKLNWFSEINGQYIIAFDKQKNRRPFFGEHEIVLNNNLHYNAGGKPKFVELPSNWNNLLYVLTSYSNHTLGNMYFNSKLRHIFKKDLVERFFLNEFNVGIKDLRSDESCLAFLISSSMNYQDSAYKALCEKRPDVMKHVFKKLKHESFLIVQSFQVFTLTANNWASEYNPENENLLLSNLDNEFYIKKQIISSDN